MVVEKRRYKVTSFKMIPGTTDVRVLLSCESAVKLKTTPMNTNPDAMLSDPMGFAQKLMNNQVNTMVRDTFLISREEYLSKKYDIGDYVTVSIEKE